MLPRVVLITGTSTGIGRAAAIGAATGGWRVVATMRDVERGRPLLDAAAAAGVAESIEVRQLDVTDGASVIACVDGVVAAHGQLDAVVNNAGSGHVGTIENQSIDDVRAVLEVNFFGVVAVTQAVLPHLRATRGRLVTVTSVGGVVGQPFNEAYCAAKFAVEGFMEALHPLAASAGVSVCVVEPGAVASEFVANVGAAGVKVDPEGPYGEALSRYLERTRARFATAAQTSEGAAATIVEALDAPSPAFRWQTSDAARAFVGVKLADLDGSAVTGLTASWIA